MRSKRIRINFIIACLTILYIFVPITKVRIVYLAIMLVLSFLANKGRGFFHSILSIGMLRIIYVFTFVSSYFIHYYSESITNSIIFILSFLIARYLILQGLTSEHEIEEFLDYLLILFSIYAVLGIIESLTQVNYFDQLFNRDVISDYGANEWRGRIYRNHGICTVSINNSMLLFMIWLLASYKAFKNKNLLYLFAFLIIGIDFVLIFSRMTLLVGFFMQFLLIAKIKGRRKLRLWFLIILGAIALILIIPEQLVNVYEYFKTYFLPLIKEFIGGEYKTSGGIYHNGSGQRIALWGWVYSFVRKNLLFGVGFVEQFSHIFIENGITKIKQSVEVHWLFVLLQKGLFGLFGFISFQFYCLKMNISNYRNNRKWLPAPNLSQVFLLITVGYFVSLFGCAGFEDLSFYYMIFGIFEAYHVVNAKQIKGESI